MSRPIRRTGGDSICQNLLDSIRSGQLAPGDTLPSENELVSTHGVSRTMVRDAVAMLTGMGVVDRQRGRRGVIQRVDSSALSRLFPVMLSLGSEGTIADAYELRILLESGAAALACRRADDASLREIEDLAAAYDREQRDAPADVERAEYIHTDLRFHAAIARASGNPMFASLLDVLTGFITHAQVESCRNDRARSAGAAREHLRIAAAIRARDPDGARAEMAHHLRVSQEALEAKLAEKQP